MYKRNQMEGAIARATGKSRGPDHAPAPELITRIKRLTETDRSITVDKRSSQTVFRRFAFFDAAAPGRGAEVWHTGYTAFALYLAVRLMDAGLPQTEAVAFLRRIRNDLEGEHSRILNRKPASFFDHGVPKDLEAEIRNGRLVRRIDNMVFLVVAAGEPASPIYGQDEQGALFSTNVCRGPKQLGRVMEFLAVPGGVPVISMELVNPAYQLRYWLDRIEPVKRGRK